jgi:hypothetical protein
MEIFRTKIIIMHYLFTIGANGYWYEQFGINELKTINYARK